MHRFIERPRFPSGLESKKKKRTKKPTRRFSTSRVTPRCASPKVGDFCWNFSWNFFLLRPVFFLTSRQWPPNGPADRLIIGVFGLSSARRWRWPLKRPSINGETPACRWRRAGTTSFKRGRPIKEKKTQKSKKKTSAAGNWLDRNSNGDCPACRAATNHRTTLAFQPSTHTHTHTPTRNSVKLGKLPTTTVAATDESTRHPFGIFEYLFFFFFFFF